jgi:phosphoglycolate phosphatase
MKIEDVIFDLDGTLVDSLPGIEYASKSAINSVFAESMEVELRPFIGSPIREIFRKIFPEIEEKKLDVLVKEFRSIYDSIGWQKTVLFDGVIDTLTQLKNAKINCYIVTSKPKSPTWNILNQLNILDYFKGIISPDLVAPSFASKAEEIFHLIDKFDLKKSNMLMVGDTQKDAEAANICGIKFVAVSYGYGHFEEDSEFMDFRMNTISDLLEIVRKEDL